MDNKKRIVIVGASSSIAEHCARLWLHNQATDLVLVGRDNSKLSRVASDLKVRNPHANIRTVQAEFLSAASIQETVDSIATDGKIDIALIAHGSLPDQAICQENLTACQEALEINGISPVLYAEAFAQHMAKHNHGTLAIIGSVAGDRGRKSNYIYGSAKGLVTRYAQGLQHRLADTNVKVILIKPGPTDTPMTSQLKAQGAKLAPVEVVSRQIVNAIASGRPVAYVPRIWGLIMMIIRHLPAVIFNRLNI